MQNVKLGTNSPFPTRQNTTIKNLVTILVSKATFNRLTFFVTTGKRKARRFAGRLRSNFKFQQDLIFCFLLSFCARHKTFFTSNFNKSIFDLMSQLRIVKNVKVMGRLSSLNHFVRIALHKIFQVLNQKCNF